MTNQVTAEYTASCVLNDNLMEYQKARAMVQAAVRVLDTYHSENGKIAFTRSDFDCAIYLLMAAEEKLNAAIEDEEHFCLVVETGKCADMPE